MDLEAVPTLFDRYSLTSLVLDHFRVSCMWLDGGLIRCTCLYNSFMYLRGSNSARSGKLNLLSIYWDSSFLSQQGPLDVAKGADTCYSKLSKLAST
jgi:hypothetical protein